MSDIGRAGGPLPINNYPQSTDNHTTTVQVGENNLSDVAKRLGADPDDLQKANPQLGSNSVLKAGQDINLPQNQSSQGPQESRERDHDRATQPPSSPIGDPMVKDFFKSKLDGAGKEKELSEKDLGQLSGGASAGKTGKDYYKPHGDDDFHSQKQIGEDHIKKTFDGSYKGTLDKHVIARDLSQTPGGAAGADQLKGEMKSNYDLLQNTSKHAMETQDTKGTKGTPIPFKPQDLSSGKQEPFGKVDAKFEPAKKADTSSGPTGFDLESLKPA
jgi:LysM repeat protein